MDASLTVDVDVALYLREIEYACQSERIIYVEVYPEEWIVLTGIQFAIECAVILVGKVGRLFGPCRFGVVDYVVAVGVGHLSVLPLLLLA